jgi:hypothetical protein
LAIGKKNLIEKKAESCVREVDTAELSIYFAQKKRLIIHN